MATIIRGGAPIITDASGAEAETFANNYWGDLTQEKSFPIAFWRVKQLLQASSSNEMALRVLNINDASSVSASWMAFESALADSLQDPVELGVYYFILEDKLFNGPILTSTTPILQLEGMSKITNTPENNIIRGRIGKDDAGQFFAFFQAAECVIIGPGGGGGVGGATGGAKVPAN